MEGWREERREMRGRRIKPQLDSQELFLICLSCILTIHCRSCTKKLSTSGAFIFILLYFLGKVHREQTIQSHEEPTYLWKHSLRSLDLI